MATMLEIPKSLEGLCSQEQVTLLNAVDDLRSAGMENYISLPQIIVCGDQSSGKSSVLEAISGVSFPVKSNVCTRFPTELVLRKTTESAVKVSIVPHHSRTNAEKASLAQFTQDLTDLSQLAAIVEKAKSEMGINASGKAFSRDLLRVEVSGPNHPHLTIVDLPGLIHSETKGQTAADIETVKNVVEGYMKEPRSIILAVVSAKNDYANQIVLKLARAADPSGKRTLGLITKPDTLRPGSGSEEAYINLAKNKDVSFHLGWHVVRNADSEADQWSLSQRDEEESKFFDSGNWASLPRSILSVQNLRTRLSKLLLQQISAELPKLISEINEKSTTCQKELVKLGEARTTIEKQRTFLTQISQTFQVIVRSAVDGTYTDPFFGDATSKLGYQRRLRARLQNLAQEFAERLEEDGQKIRIKSDSTQPAYNGSQPDEREFLIRHVIKIMKRSRGRELPGMFNPMIVGDLFKQQVAPWKDFSVQYLKTVHQESVVFVKQVLEHIAGKHTGDMIYTSIVCPKLQSSWNQLKAKGMALLKPYGDGHPITYNHYFTDTIQKTRGEKRVSDLTSLVENFFSQEKIRPGYYVPDSMDVQRLIEQLVARVVPDMDRFAAMEALDFLEAYHKVAMKRFIDDVAVQAVEVHLVFDLIELFEPSMVSMMSSDEIKKIASEPEEHSKTRDKLQSQRKVLKYGAKICKTFANFQETELRIDGRSTVDVVKGSEYED